MAGLTTGGPNVDVSLLYEVNGAARRAPAWLDTAVGTAGEYGILLALVLLVLWCWRGARRQEESAAAETFTALVWAPLAAGLALIVNVPLRELVGRQRPFRQHEGLQVLDPGWGVGLGNTEFSFVSGHTTVAMALAVGLFVANRRLGTLGIGLALAVGVCRVYMGVNYPTDVIGGLALGTAVVLVLAPLALALLSPVVRAVAGSRRFRRLVRAGDRARPLPVDLAQPQTPPAGRRPQDKDLAA
ncbi:phosphatase PAP2 family protein [Streptomyces erythrochromogenes]|uniref:phosphatase PAP2 family protein n=1 Tax=Streptomyces erythrochromogenes TaxID=285574 RepID=UPI003419B080